MKYLLKPPYVLDYVVYVNLQLLFFLLSDVLGLSKPQYIRV